jgi:hypothetical protein
MGDPRANPNGYSPNQNQSEFYAPITSVYGDKFMANGMRLSRGFQTYLPGPYHFEDAYGQIGTAGYMPAPIYQINVGFDGDVPIKEAPKFTQPLPWQRGAQY